MGKFLRRYYGILLALVFFVLSLQYSLGSRSLPTPARQVEWVVSSISFPVFEFFSDVKSRIERFFHDYLLLTGIAKENRALREEVRRLKAELTSLEEVKRENARLKKLLSFVGDGNENRRTIVARVVTHDLSPWSRGFFISAGERDGVSKGMAVVVPEGVVGKVYRVFYSGAYVISLVDHRFSLDVRTSGGRVRCILKGTGSGLVVKYLRTTDDVREGELLITTGFEGAFPQGTPAAVISSVGEEPGSIFRKVEAVPLADMRKIEEVVVVLESGASAARRAR